MLKKNILLLLLIIIPLTGCTVEYKLDIDENIKLHENITITPIIDTEINKIKAYNSYIPINIDIDEEAAFKKKYKDLKYYKYKKDNNNNMIIKSSHDINQFNTSRFANSCYEYIALSKTKTKEEKENLLLSTSKKFLCFDMYEELDEVKITITSTYKLKETNADEVKRHTYSWNINRSNKDNKVIYLLLDTTEQDLNFWERLKNGEYTNIFTISLLLFIIGIIIYGYLKRKSIKRDEI